MLSKFCTALCLWLLTSTAFAQALPDGYDVVLLVGQSNMAGTGTGPDNAADAAPDKRVFQWDANNGRIIQALDPLIQNPTNLTGLGLTFGKAYAASLPGNRKVLLVGSASGGTSLVSGRWQAPNGDLAVTAVTRANDAMAVAGPGARFVGILWHQGESDIIGNGAPTYRANLLGMINFFRSRITGASSSTPFIAGEFTYPWIADNSADAARSAAQDTVLNVIHTLPDTVPHTGWVSAAGLGTDSQTGIIHFSALALRDFGRRYAKTFLAVKNNLLVNGDFESNTVAAGGVGLQTALAGWQGSGGVVEVWRNFKGWSAASGSSWIELDAGTAVDAVSQKLSTPAATVLSLRFWYAARPGVDALSNRFEVLWNGTVIDTLAPDGMGLTSPRWASKAYLVTATGEDTLTFRESGTNDGMGALVDAVSLSDLGLGRTPALANLALGKAAKQSSDAFGGVASRAVDGNVNGNFSSNAANNSVTHTYNSPQEWWQVDLGASQWVQSVKLYNRSDCCADRLSNFYVLVSQTDMTGKTLAQLLADPTVIRQQVPAATAVTDLSFGASGRYVRVQLAGTNYLNLAEVQVLGLPLNLALGKPTSQSSTAFWWGGDAARAVDGNTDGHYNSNSVSHTDITAQPWWQVDLGKVASIDAVQVWNRTDCCAERLSNFIVFVSATDMTGKTLAQLQADTTVQATAVSSHNGSAVLSFALRGGSGRYVRVQLTGTNYLNLAEVQVLGH